MTFRKNALAIAILGIGATACGGGTADVDVELKQPDLSLAGVAAGRIAPTPERSTNSVVITAAGANYSFTPVSFKVPVKLVQVEGDEGAIADIIACSGSDAECLIDFADQDSLDDASAEAASTLSAGTYTEGSFSLCEDNESQTDKTIYVKGKWTEGDTTYYTTADATDPISTDEADWGETAVTVNTCKLKMKFSSDLVVADGDAVSITLFPIITGAAYFHTDSEGTEFEPCVNGTNEAVCINLPNMIPYVGSGDATLESYRVGPADGDADTAYGLVHLLFDEDGNAFGGMTLAYYRPGTDAFEEQKSFGQALVEISQNDEGETYSFMSYGSNPSADTYGYLNWSEFTRIEAVGTTNEQTFQASMDGQTLGAATSCKVERVDPADLKDGT